MRPIPALVIGLTIAATAAGRAQADPDVSAAVNDPAEHFNRKVFALNQAIDRHLMRPVARGYAFAVPQPGRTGLRNVLSNLGEPQVFANDILQAHIVRASSTLGRFGLNSTVGVAGIFDVASRAGLRRHDADLGQTFGRWGVGAGPHLELPLLGPSNVRDAIGAGLGRALDPLSFLTTGAAPAVRMGTGAVGAVDGRARLLPVTDQLQAQSTDYYATVRDLYSAHRVALVRQALGGAPHPPAEDVAEPAPPQTP